MHCLVVLPFAAETGANGRKADAIETLLEAHRRLGVDLSVVALEPEPTSACEIYRSFGVADRIGTTLLRSVRYGRARHAGNRIWRRRLLDAIAHSHGKKSIDVSFACSMLRVPSIFCSDLWKKTGIPYVIQEHRTSYQRTYSDRASVPQADLDALDNALAVFGLTEAHADQVSKVVGKEVDVVPLALPDTHFAPVQDMSVQRPNQQGQWTIAAWTNWRDFKRLDLVIAAFVLIGRTDPDARLVVGGPVPTRQLADVKALLAASGLDGRVEFRGPLSRQGINNLAHSCDVCLVASDHETFGIPASEALAAGRPVVVTQCGGPETFVVEGANGYSVPTGNARAIADALQKIRQNPAPFNDRQISADAAARFSVDTLSSRLLSVYGSLGLLPTTPCLRTANG